MDFLFDFFLSKELFPLLVLQFTGYHVFARDADCIAEYLRRLVFLRTANRITAT